VKESASVRPASAGCMGYHVGWPVVSRAWPSISWADHGRDFERMTTAAPPRMESPAHRSMSSGFPGAHMARGPAPLSARGIGEVGDQGEGLGYLPAVTLVTEYSMTRTAMPGCPRDPRPLRAHPRLESAGSAIPHSSVPSGRNHRCTAGPTTSLFHAPQHVRTRCGETPRAAHWR